MFFHEQYSLLISSLCAAIFALIFFHEKEEILCMLFFCFMGTLFEHAGVYFHQWGYFNLDKSWVPWWYLTLWGGVGLFARRYIYFA